MELALGGVNLDPEKPCSEQGASFAVEARSGGPWRARQTVWRPKHSAAKRATRNSHPLQFALGKGGKVCAAMLGLEP